MRYLPDFALLSYSLALLLVFSLDTQLQVEYRHRCLSWVCNLGKVGKVCKVYR